MKLSVFRHITNPGADRIFGLVDLEFFPIQIDLARFAFVGSEDQACQFGSSRADQPGQPKRFALAELEVGPLTRLPSDMFLTSRTTRPAVCLVCS